MKRNRIGIVFGLVIYSIVILGFVFYIPYYVNEDGLSISIFNANMQLTAQLLLVLIFTTVTYLLTQLIVLIYPRLIDIKLINYACRTFPMYPIISLVVWLVFGFFDKMSEYDYASLGIDFVNANIDSYGSTLTHSDIIAIGESLKAGIGMYLIWVLTLLIVVQYIWYYIKFYKIFGVDEISE